MNPNPLDPANARTAIENIMFTYAECIDGGDFAGVAALFSKARMVGPDGSVQGTGAEEIEQIYHRSTQLYEDGTPMTQHVTTNLIFEFSDDGRTAHVRSRFTVMQQLPDFPLQCIITGYYEDTFAFSEEAAAAQASAAANQGAAGVTGSQGWHFTERRMKPKLAGDLSRHLKYDLANA